MRNSVLTAALESVDPAQVMPRDSFIEKVEELRDQSNEFTPAQLVEDEQQLAGDMDSIDTLAEHVQKIEPDNQVAMESIKLGLNAITSRYGIGPMQTSMESGADQREAVLNHIGAVKASLEGALTVSQESWAVRDLWDSISAVERNATELESATKQLGDRKQWFSEHGIVIDSLGQLKYLTVNEQMTKNFTKDTTDTLNHAEALIDCAEVASDTTAKIRDLVKRTQLASDDDALDLLKKVVALKNPSQAAKQKLDGVFLLGNAHGEFKITPVKNRNGLSIGDWENIGSYTRTDLGRLDHGVKASKLLRVPGWLAGFWAGGNTVAVAAKVTGMGVAAAGAGALAAGITIGFLVSTSLNDSKAGKQFKHNIKFDEVKSALDKTVQLARKSSQARRAMPGHFERMVTMRDEVKSLIDMQSKTLGPEGKAAMTAIRTMYSSAEKLAWALNMEGFALMREVVTNSDMIARKMVTASK